MKSKVLQMMIGAVGAMALTTGIAVAGDEGKELTEEQKSLMSQLDSNGDGVISNSEAQNHPELAQRFQELDENRDSVLEQAEFARFEIQGQPME
ncbi:MAG: hypothetical protein RQ847_01880 [Wenzhouxiangellaceae bacterium]|nr:hypothetical protein [Wenzhouxiangellaceae bacterium]